MACRDGNRRLVLPLQERIATGRGPRDDVAVGPGNLRLAIDDERGDAVRQSEVSFNREPPVAAGPAVRFIEYS